MTAAVALVAAVLVALPAPSIAQTIDAKQAQAAALEARIKAQGQRLSLADEQFNQARVERQRIESRATQAKSAVAAAEQKWAAYKQQLNRRVRLLYMHPGASLDAFFGARTFPELARAKKLGSEVMTADNELLNTTEQARRHVMAEARKLDNLRDSAASKEKEIAGHRATVSRELGQQRALLQEVKGDIAKLIAQQRAAEIAAAQRASSAGGGPAIGDTPGNNAAPGADPVAQEPSRPPPPPKAGAAKAVAVAAAQIGKPYEWAAAGPDTFDCSGLTMYAWAAAGVSLVHSSQAQFASLPHVARGSLRPGDLVFFGRPIHHVGIYEGGGVMINAPETGENVRRDSIGRSDYAGAARP